MIVPPLTRRTIVTVELVSGRTVQSPSQHVPCPDSDSTTPTDVIANRVPGETVKNSSEDTGVIPSQVVSTGYKRYRPRGHGAVCCLHFKSRHLLILRHPHRSAKAAIARGNPVPLTARVNDALIVARNANTALGLEGVQRTTPRKLIDTTKLSTGSQRRLVRVHLSHSTSALMMTTLFTYRTRRCCTSDDVTSPTIQPLSLLLSQWRVGCGSNGV